MLKSRKGQSTLEYVIVFTAIVAALIAGVALLAGQDKTSGVGKLMDKLGSNMQAESAKVAEIVN